MADWNEDPDMEDAKVKTKQKVLPISLSKQTEEEIERFTLSDSLTDTKKILFLLASGTPEQKQAVYFPIEIV